MLKREIGKLFPNLNKTLAYYSPTSFSVTLNTISESQILELNDGVMDKQKAKHLSILFHELTHHVDHISTLWGQKNIKKLFESVNSKLNLDEYQFFKIIEFKIAEQQLHYAEYYTEQYNKIPWKSNSPNWKWQLSTGYKFTNTGLINEDNPIIFMRFATHDGKNLVRVPLSIASLLETNSSKEEIKIMMTYLNNLASSERIIETSIYNREIYEKIIYNQDLAVYNAAVHLVANLLNLSEIGVGLEISSAIATLALNLPYDLIHKIPINNEKLAAWGDRPLKMAKNNDYGFLFYNLLLNYIPFFNVDNVFSMKRLLEANKLPTEVEILQLINNEIDKIIESYSYQPNFKDNFKTISIEGKRILNIRGIDGTHVSISDLVANYNYTPFVICNDTDFPLEDLSMPAILGKLPIDGLTPQQWYSFADSIDKKMDEFFNIRGL